MTLKARVARLEGSISSPDDLPFRRMVTCTVRIPRVEEDTQAAYAEAGLSIEDGDIIRQIIYEWPGQHTPPDPAFVPRVLSVLPIGGRRGLSVVPV